MTCSRPLNLPEETSIIIGPWFTNSRQAAALEKGEVVDHHWGDRDKLFSDNERLDTLYENVLSELAEHLNCRHGISRSIRYWRILIGPWLSMFIHILYDRWSQMRVSLELHREAVIVIPENRADFVCRDMREFLTLFSTDEWNDSIFRDLALMSNHPIMRVKGHSVEGIENGRVSQWSRGLITMLKELARSVQLRSQTKKVGRQNWVILGADVGQGFLQSILGNEYERLVSLPARSVSWRSTCKSASLKEPEPLKNFDSFENVLWAMIPRNIPKSYTSDYSKVQSEASSFPNRVAGILSANSHIPDDIIKHWVGEMVELGVPLYTVQHGGHFGIARRPWYELHDIAIADKFLTWGWNEDGFENLLPIGYSKVESPIRTKEVNSELRQILLVQLGVPRYAYWIHAFPLCASFEKYLSQQIRFVSKLSAHVMRNLLIRLNPNDYGWRVHDKWLTEFNDVKIDASPAANMSAILSQSRLVISTYNATMFLDTLYHNVPTVIFWDPEMFELREGAEQAFDRLLDVGVFFTDPDLACAHLNAVAADIEGWWFSEPVQDARRQFCNQFARRPSPINQNI